MPEMYLLVPVESGYQKVDVVFSVFPDGDIHCVVPDSERLVGKPVLVFTRIYPDQNTQIMRLLFLLDLLRTVGTAEISIFCPYLPYSRQDKRHIAGEAISINTVCRLLVRAGCKRLYTLDCHFMKGRAQEVRCGLQVNNISLGQELVRACSTIGNEPFQVLGPDKGSHYLVQKFGAQHMHKQRGNYSNLDGGDSYRDVIELRDDHITLSGEAVIVLDDMISTGTTIIQTVRILRQRNVPRIYCATTHGLFLNGSYRELAGLVDGIVFSDSVRHQNSLAMVDGVLRESVIPFWLANAK